MKKNYCLKDKQEHEGSKFTKRKKNKERKML